MPSLGAAAELRSAFWAQSRDLHRAQRVVLGLFKGGRCVLPLAQQENPFILRNPEILFLFTSCSTGLDDSAGSFCERIMSLEVISF